MRALKWSASVAVFVTDIDDQHREIFEAISNLRKAITLSGPSLEIRKLTEHLVTSLSEHFAHEERLMHAARYGSLRWHKEKHNAARRRVRQFVQRMGQGDSEAGPELVDYLSGWLPDH